MANATDLSITTPGSSSQGTIDSSSSYNLVGTTGTGVTLSGLGNQVVGATTLAAQGIATFGDYGGPTRTHTLLPSSTAIDAGDSNLAPGATDQRGPRFERVLGTSIDIGAVESAIIEDDSSGTRIVTVYGSSGDDTITASADGVYLGWHGGFRYPIALDAATELEIFGGDGHDLLNGFEGNDRIHGGAGDDAITGGGGDDELYGGDGEDSLFGDAGADLIEGGLGADLIVGGDGDDTLHGSLIIGGGQTAVLDDGSDTIDGGAGADSLHVDYLETPGSAFKQAGGDFFETELVDTVTADGAGVAPDPSLTTPSWTQDKLWDDNYGFGEGWNLLGVDRLEYTGGGGTFDIKWVRADGHTVDFTGPWSQWTPVSGDPMASEITFETSTGRFIKTDKYGGVSEYVAVTTGVMVLVKSVDRLGVGREYTYGDHDGDGVAMEIESVKLVRPGQLDETIQYVYPTTATATNPTSRVSQIIDPFGRVTDIEYDASDRVTKILLPEVIASSSKVKTIEQRVGKNRASGRPTIDFTYDSNGFVNWIGTPDDSIDTDTSIPEQRIAQTFTWQANGELYIDDADTSPMRYLGAPHDAYNEWIETTAGWQDYLPAFLLTDGLEGLIAGQTKDGYAVDELGRTTLFKYNHDGAVVESVNPTGVKLVINHNSAGQVTSTTTLAPGDSRVVDLVTHTYDTVFNRVTTTHLDGSTEVWDYDPTFSQLTSYTDEVRRQTLYEIDPTNGNTIESRVVVGQDDRTSSEVDDVVTLYEYTADGLLSIVTRPRHSAAGVEQFSHVMIYAYSTIDNTVGTGHVGRWLTVTTEAADVQPGTPGLQLTNQAITSVVQRDDYGNPIEIRDPEGRSTFYEYDILDRMILASTQDPGFGQQPVGTEWDYSLGGRINATSRGATNLSLLPYASGSASSLSGGGGTLASDNSLTSENNYNGSGDSNGSETIDEWGRIFVCGSCSSDDGDVDSLNDDTERETTFKKGSNGNYGTSTSGLSSSSSASSQFIGGGSLPASEEVGDSFWHWNARGEVITVFDSAGVLTYRTYDERGRETFTGVAHGAHASTSYNDAGDVVQEVDGEGRSIAYAYDDAGRVISAQSSGVSNATLYTYDTHGNVEAVTDPNLITQHFGYDERGLAISHTDAESNTTSFTYYLDDLIKSVTDANLNVTDYTYDSAGRLYSETIYDDSMAPLTRTMRYDEQNRVVEEIDRNGRRTELIFFGTTLERENWYSEGGALSKIFLYEYYRDDFEEEPYWHNGYLLSVNDGESYYGYQYDTLGRVTTEFQRHQADGHFDVSVRTNTSYDAGERVQSTQVGATQDFFSSDYEYYHNLDIGYDGAGRVSSLTQTYDEGSLNDKRVEFTYNHASQLAYLSRYASSDASNPVVSTAYSYDSAARIQQIAHNQSAAGALLAGYHYGYDAGSRLTTFDFLPDGTNSAFDYSPESAAYTYDARNQIDTADYAAAAGVEEDYAFDATGNRVGAQVIDGATVAYGVTVGANNRLLDDGVYTYTYDNEGNRVTRTLKSGTSDQYLTEYEWDHRNRLTAVVFKNNAGMITETVEYTYDYKNQLIARERDTDGDLGNAPKERTVYIHHDGQVVLQYDRVGEGDMTTQDLSHRYLWGPQVDMLLADEEIDWSNSQANGDTLWALTDHLGTVRDLVDDAGVVQNHKSYDAFGNVTAETNAAKDTVFGYTGKLYDDATELQNNLNRWYDSSTGNWISEDPIGFEGGDYNLGRYVGNMPTQLLDPDGLEWLGPGGTIYDPTDPFDPSFDPTAPQDPQGGGVNEAFDYAQDFAEDKILKFCRQFIQDEGIDLPDWIPGLSDDDDDTPPGIDDGIDDDGIYDIEITPWFPSIDGEQGAGVIIEITW